jgi:hypothetical protein
VIDEPTLLFFGSQIFELPLNMLETLLSIASVLAILFPMLVGIEYGSNPSLFEFSFNLLSLVFGRLTPF